MAFINWEPLSTGYNQGMQEDTYLFLQKIGIRLLNQDEIKTNVFFQPQQGKMAFSPLSANLFSSENVLILLLFMRLLKDPQLAVKMLEKYMDSTVKIIAAIEDAGTSHPMTASLAHMLCSAFMHRMGLLDDAGYLHNVSHISSVFEKTFAMLVVSDTLSGVSTLVKNVGGAVAPVLK